MLRWPLLLLPLLPLIAGCSNGPEADLPHVSAARSLTAEWALVNDEAQKGHLTGSYVRTMRRSVREQLQATRSSLVQPQSDYGREISAILKEPDGATADRLRAHAAKLKQIELSLESA
jgi:hypothetical protein